MTALNVPRESLSRLVEPGGCLGWTFTPRRMSYGQFAEKKPVRREVSPRVSAEADRARGTLGRRLLGVILVGSGFTGVFAGSAWLAGHSPMPSLQGRLTAWAVVMAAATAGGVVLAIMRYRAAVGRPGAAERKAEKQYQREQVAYNRRLAKFEQREEKRLAKVPEWSAIHLPDKNRTLDVVGGDVWGWEAFMTVYGASLLGAGDQITLVDVSGDATCRGLVHLAATMNVPLDVQLLTPNAPGTDLLSGLDRDQLVDVLVEAMHAPALLSARLPADSVQSSTTREQRSIDARILRAITEKLGDDVSVGRLWAGVRRLLNEPTDELLTGEESRRLSDETFSDDYVRNNRGRLELIEAALKPLRDLKPQVRPADRVLTCYAMPSKNESDQDELLPHLAVRWLTHRIIDTVPTTRTDGRPRFTFILNGADRIAPPHLVHLADVCARHEVRLVTISRSMQATLGQGLGRGPVGYMRLSSEAEAAANRIGRGHKFVRSQMAKSIGGDSTHSAGNTVGGDESTGHGHDEGHSGDFADILGLTRGWSESESRHWNTSRSWGTSWQISSGSNHSKSTTESRVYEYHVEPNELEALPDYGMLLVGQVAGATERVTAINFNPDLVRNSAVSMQPTPQPGRLPVRH